MSELCLYIPDRPLRDAVIEQIAAAKLGAVRVLDQAVAWQPVRGDILILDAAASDSTSLVQGARDSAEKPVILLLGGGDDVEGVSESLAKPLRLGHLITRLRYYLETAPLLRDRVVTFGPYRFEPQNRRIMSEAHDDPIRLTEKETALLVYIAHSDRPVTRQEILAAVWGYGDQIDTHTLETHIYQLRRKLDTDGGAWLVNEAGAYRLARGQA